MKKTIIFILTLILCVLGYLSYIKYTKLDARDYFLNNNEIIAIAHKGIPSKVQEHTFESYDKAIELGSKIIDLDLVSSKDGILFVTHDENAKNMLGIDKDFSKLDSIEIKKMKTVNGSQLLELEDVFKKYGKRYYYTIELKVGQSQFEEFSKIVKKYKLDKNILIQSFFLEPLKLSKEVFPEMPIAILERKQENIEQSYDIPYVDIIITRKSYASENLVYKTHMKSNKKIMFYTMDTNEEHRYMKKIKADGYFTNDYSMV